MSDRGAVSRGPRRARSDAAGDDAAPRSEPPRSEPPRSEPPRDEPAPIVARSADVLTALAARAERADRVALDVEANGLFAFRPALCVLQLAFLEEGAIVVAVVDTLATGVQPLAALLGPSGPIKVLHDLTFDAKLLADAGTPLARVRDTSVAARLLGIQTTGLAAVLASELGVTIDKRFQQHDWSERPLGAVHIDYLASDVRHLLALDDHLAARAAERDITEEIAEECAHKLVSALGPPRDARPAYARVKGAPELDPPGRAALRRLFAARDRAAESADVPPFKVVASEVLLELARKRPADTRGLAAVRGALSGRAGRHAHAWLAAIADGVRDGDVPEEDRALFDAGRGRRGVEDAWSRRSRAEARAREAQVSAFRKAEAKRRGVDEQAVLPGHCASGVVQAMIEHGASESALREAIAAVPGFGARRSALYLDALVAIGLSPLPAPKRRGPEGDPPA